MSIDNGKSYKVIRDYVKDFITSKELISGTFRFNQPQNLKICLGQEPGKQKTWHPYKCTILIKIVYRTLFRNSTPDEYLALKNYSNGKTEIAHMRMNLPHLNNNKEWINASRIKLDNFESFTVANMVLGEFGLLGTKMDTPDIFHQEVHHLEKNSKISD